MSIKEQVAKALDHLGDAELQEVADYMAFLKFRARAHATVPRDAAESALFYAEFAAEDRELANAGMEDYAAGLAAEDQQ